MIKRILHRAVAHPTVYNAVQRLAGCREVHRRIREALPPLPPNVRILDMGGGTGLLQGALPTPSVYICSDLDPQKMEGYRQRNPGGIGLLSDATALPVPDGALQATASIAMAHHLDDEQFEGMVTEAHRALGPGGLFIFLDPVWAPERWRGRLLWRFDRGEHPRTPERLRDAIAKRFEIVVFERFAIHHEYAIIVGRRGAGS